MEFDIKGVAYRAAKLSVFDQLHISRKLLPVLAGMASDFSQMQTVIREKNMAGAMESIVPKIAKELAALSNEDCNTVIYPCLSVVSRKNGDVWTAVFSHGVLQFDDISLFSLLQIVARVIGDSLGNFLQELPTIPTPAPQVG